MSGFRLPALWPVLLLFPVLAMGPAPAEAASVDVVPMAPTPAITAAVANGGIYKWTGDREVPDIHNTLYDYGKFQAVGRTLEEAFGNAALATASLMWDWRTVQPRFPVSVHISGKDREQLLVKFLNELIYLFETRDFVIAAAEDVHIENWDGAWTLKAVLRGDDLAAGYEVHGLVKAATYNEMQIEEDDGFAVQVVVDM